jgi:arginase family enzyme
MPRRYCVRSVPTGNAGSKVQWAPLSYLINKHGADLAILWIDSHPDMGTGGTAYPGFHAMVVSALTGHGDQELLQILPATTTADRVALVGLHDWIDPMLPAIAAEWVWACSALTRCGRQRAAARLARHHRRHEGGHPL